MEKKEIAKWMWWGAVIGVVVILIIGFGFGGWVLGSTAQKRVNQMVEKTTIDCLSPVCVERFQQDPNREAKFKELEETRSWDRGDFVMKQGWATIPGQEEPNRDVAGECARSIIDLRSK